MFKRYLDHGQPLPVSMDLPSSTIGWQSSIYSGIEVIGATVIFKS